MMRPMRFTRGCLCAQVGPLLALSLLAGACGDAATGPGAGPGGGQAVKPDSAADLGTDISGQGPSDVRAELVANPDTAADGAADTYGQTVGDTRTEVANRLDAANDSGAAVYIGLPQPMCVWNEAYQENYAADTVAEILSSARSCYVLIDPFANTEARGAIGQIQQNRNLVGCYISTGTCEDWRDDYAAMKPYCVSKQWGEWPGEFFVDRTDPALVALMEVRLDKMAAWGCNMVEFDNMDWAFDSANRTQYGVTATSAQGESYNQALCAYAHANGMGCMAKSSAQGAANFDGLTVESAPGNLDWWESAHMQGMLSSGKIGIVVHYDETDCAGVRTTYQSKYGSKLSFICEDRALKKYRHFP